MISLKKIISITILFAFVTSVTHGSISIQSVGNWINATSGGTLNFGSDINLNNNNITSIKNINSVNNINVVNFTSIKNINSVNFTDSLYEECSFLVFKKQGVVNAKNCTTGVIVKSGNFMTVMNYLTNQTSDSNVKIVLQPNRYSINIPNSPPHNRSIWFNQSNITIDGQNSIIYNDGSGAGLSGSYFKQGNNAVSDIEIKNIIFDDSLSNGTTHQIIGFDGVVNHIYIHDNRFENLYNSATIINAASSPYARNVRYINNWHSKNITHQGGDFIEIMGKNIYIRDNYFEETTNPASVAIVPSFGVNMEITGNTLVRSSPGDMGIELDPLDTMSGETYSFRNVILKRNIITYGNLGVSAGNTNGQNAAWGVLISDNEIFQGVLQLQGGIVDATIHDNILKGNSWITISGAVTGGSNASIYNLKLNNNIINGSNNIGSLIIEKINKGVDIEIENNQFLNDAYSSNINMALTSGATFTNFTVVGNTMPKGIAKYGTFTNYVFKNNLGSSPFNFGNSATAPTAFGKGDIYFNTTTNKPCYSTSSGTGNWYTYGDVAGC